MGKRARMPSQKALMAQESNTYGGGQYRNKGEQSRVVEVTPMRKGVAAPKKAAQEKGTRAKTAVVQTPGSPGKSNGVQNGTIEACRTKKVPQPPSPKQHVDDNTVVQVHDIVQNEGAIVGTQANTVTQRQDIGQKDSGWITPLNVSRQRQQQPGGEEEGIRKQNSFQPLDKAGPSVQVAKEVQVARSTVKRGGGIVHPPSTNE
ncbi:hypothetical protein K7X08_017520 [Anisodus acutangulus]|uniref:Uncharacterized protein n=1 Tax=Anisodus acutangulus TaxID=402998 RepID=A0A9Q1R8M2_9SOLA|nr:hypothetical protein K7X08_017520 [Anisodus acutangulus]